MADQEIRDQEVRRILWEANGELDTKKRLIQQFGPTLLRNTVVWFNRLGSRSCVIELEDGQDIRANVVRCHEAEVVGEILREACKQWRGGSTKSDSIAWAKQAMRDQLGDELVDPDPYVWIRKTGYAVCRTRTRAHRRFVVDYWPGKHAPQFQGQDEETD